MNLKISEKLTQPKVSWYIDWLGRAGYRNVNCNMAYDERSYELMDELFALLAKIKPLTENGARSILICAKRGSIEDFAEYHGTYEECLEDEAIKDRADYEAYWRESFPNDIEWYELTAVYQKDIDYQAVLLQHRQVLEQDGREERAAYTHDISEFVEWLIDSIQ